ncbi:histidinol-phosphatase [Desulfovibrio sp. OttesenSCG-928-O18]|nr:histidinol-phosphatase [Desulfovibrio sp. OttesenSCG-928-O18]
MSITVDLHNHTLHSHAKDTAEAMAASAFARGMAIYGFSEHSPRPAAYPYPGDYRDKLTASFPRYITDVAAEQERYKGRMEVLRAIEMDYMPDEMAFTEEALARCPYDYVIGGLHFIGHWGFDHSASDWESLSDAACFEHFVSYYKLLANMAATGLFNIAAHPDLVKLFRKKTFTAWVATPDAQEHVRAALAAMKKAGMAMEISSAAIRKGLGEPYPCREVMALAQEIGVPISFGSDAHAVDQVAFAFDELAAYAQEYGYTESAVFRQRVMTLRPFV